MNALKAVQRLENLEYEITALSYAIQAVKDKPSTSVYANTLEQIKKHKESDKERITEALKAVQLSL